MKPLREWVGSAAVYVTGLLVALSVVGFAVRSTKASRQADVQDSARLLAQGAAGPRVLVTRAVAAPPTRMVTIVADVHGRREAKLYAKVSGYLRSLDADRGDSVREGQRLARIESPETDQQLLSASADLAAKRVTAGRARSLGGTGALSQQEIDDAEASLRVAQAETSRVSALRRYELLSAPFDGVVTAHYLDPGAFVPAATSAGQGAQPVLEIADVSSVRVYGYVDHVDAANVHVGDAAAILSDARVEPVMARVSRVPHALDPRTRTMLVEIDVDNAKGTFLPGDFVRVRFEVPAAPSQSVPSSAIVFHHGEPQVVTVSDGVAHFRRVELGDDDGKSIRITSGVEAGDAVVVQPSDDVSDGRPVQVVDKEAKP
jgi:RND family efflux transporter MFP subunit